VRKEIMPHGKEENSLIIESQIKKLDAIQDNQLVILDE
jgi:hypothetical protein